MQATFFSLMMALLWTSAIIIGLYFLRKNINTVTYFNAKILFYMYLLCVIRICFPFEFPFTKVVNTPFLYNWLFPFFTADLDFLPISPCEILIIIWGIVSFFMLLKLFYEYYHIMKRIQLILSFQDDNITQAIKMKFPEFKTTKHVIVNSTFQTPMQIGFFHPVILLPTINYSSEDLYYILKHEMTHYYNHDTWIKLGINLWRCFFWWFPLTYLLYYELDESLELKCDYIVTKKMTSIQKANYLSALLHVLESQSTTIQDRYIIYNKATAFCRDKESLLRRFHYITSPKKQHNYTVIISIVFLVLFLSSYSFIFQSYGQPIYDNDNGIYFSEDNAYIIYNNNGTYELYIDDEFAAKLDELNSTKLIQAGIAYHETETR